METIGTWWMWVGFLAIVLVMLAIDLFLVGGGKQHKVGFKEAATWSGILGRYLANLRWRPSGGISTPLSAARSPMPNRSNSSPAT